MEDDPSLTVRPDKTIRFTVDPQGQNQHGLYMYTYRVRDWITINSVIEYLTGNGRNMKCIFLLWNLATEPSFDMFQRLPKYKNISIDRTGTRLGPGL